MNEPVDEAADTFARSWSAEILERPPLIAPARQYIWPLAIPGEEDALARGAVRLNVRPASGPVFLLQCALGFRDPAMPTGVFACPDLDTLCAVAGGYAYLGDTRAPERPVHLRLRPVVAVRPVVAANLLLFLGFHTIAAWGADGLAWETARLSFEGLRLGEITPTGVQGWGWDLRTDREREFRVDLRTGAHTGGAFS